ncbi:alpha/beta hydrolase [bacterium]|nr:alpha/beta hydrolase [bacterium]
MVEKDSKYRLFDLPEVTRFLFHPRQETIGDSNDLSYTELQIPVEEQVSIGGRFYFSNKNSPNLIFFHGNGEIVADYHDIAALFYRMNVNFIPVDYRGYGKSSGSPTVSNMMSDCHIIFKFIKDYLAKQQYTGAVVIMGRSLGSASALEIVSNYADEIDGLIIESGFAFAVPLLQLLGINTDLLGLAEDEGFNNYSKIESFSKPTLIIHAEFDHIIPFSDGRHLFNKSSDENKKLLMIPGANHNDILARGLEVYMTAIKELIERSITFRDAEYI